MRGRCVYHPSPADLTYTVTVTSTVTSTVKSNKCNSIVSEKPLLDTSLFKPWLQSADKYRKTKIKFKKFASNIVKCEQKHLVENSR